MTKHHNTGGRMGNRTDFARGSLLDILGCLEKPSKGELLAKVVLQIETIAEKYRQEVKKRHPNPITLGAYEKKFLRHLDEYKMLEGRPYMAGKCYIDMLCSNAKNTVPARSSK